jgi:eukaryotic-like serine/threonine-protein kinase
MERVGAYRLLRKIGQGAMAEVYLARDERAERDVALKVLNRDLTRNADLVRRFRQEAQWAALVRHPNVLTVYEVGEDEGTHFLASEFVAGQTLRQRMNHSRIPLTEVADIAGSIAEALEAAHREWVVHRDVKPENVMLAEDGAVKVLDFGLAKLARRDPDRRATEPGIVVGTLQYAAPEQAVGLGVDPRADIFSLGVVLYEMVSGRPPFRGEPLRVLLREILELDPPPLGREGVPLPRDLIQLVGRAMQKDPERRYQTAREISLALRGLRPALAFAEPAQ